MTTIRVAEPDLSDLELAYVTDAVRSGEVSSMGAYVEKFERAFADFCEVPHAVSCMNGTVALHLALIGLEVGPGDEVIVPALTFVSTANAVVHAGATPVFADVDPHHWGLDPAAVEAKITPRTKAIIVVHLYGHPADMDPLVELCRARGIALIEDAAEAHGARYKGRRVGSIGVVGTFSFYGNKIMTTGEGGAITTSDPAIADRMRMFKNHGNDPTRRYWHKVIGYNYRMTNLQAALGLAQVERAAELLAVKAEIAAVYREGMAGLPLAAHATQPWAEPVHWMTCALADERSPLSSLEIRERLGERGIETRPFFAPIPKLLPYASDESFPVSERLAEQGMNLPSGPKLALDEVRTVTAALRDILSN
ncbi:MAG: DegT/DnrJ/EryC1/StrS family aminotransferase [Sphingomonadaceae bacterium]|nr:DegT/DnrJ/EryC1/StrS family aminotransferase [Sphingomonadaceae bacterium]